MTTARASAPRLRSRRLRGEAGAALVELAFALPLLMVILVGTIDFSRAFRTAMIVTNAARAGAQYGSQSAGASGDTAGMEAAALAVLTANGLSSGPLVTSLQTCFCATTAGAFGAPVACATTTCTGGQHLVVSVTVTAQRTFSMINPFPGLPSGVTIKRGATARAQ